ncbi:MAG: ATP-dependent sacrificial sulfur transferase LarE [Bdellovibrio bacteriovorus]
MHDPAHQCLLDRLRRLGSAAVAFSGGADSGLLLALTRDACKGRVLALTSVAPYMARQEISEAVAFTTGLGVRHELIELPMPQSMEDNPPDRCYLCKRALYEQITAAAVRLGFTAVLDGTNLDDLKDYRPGLRAVRELGILTPLLDCLVAKADVRRISHALGLSSWRKPTNACLLTRLPFGQRVSMPTLQRIEEAERVLLAEGFDWVRVRLHGTLARIEVARDQRGRLLEQSDAVVSALKALGFHHVTLDLEGYRLGSMNEPLV